MFKFKIKLASNTDKSAAPLHHLPAAAIELTDGELTHVAGGMPVAGGYGPGSLGMPKGYKGQPPLHVVG